ncbi:MAG TPA: hypothetical protein VLH56_04060 [Dissulfurispiraceae bacterium]|nr:hypothetical protein [Dissulfurispiraceae bacterium]
MVVNICIAGSFIGTYRKLGYIDDGMLVKLDLKQFIDIHRLSDMLPVSITSAPGHELADEAVAYYQSTSYLFAHHLNRWEQ